MAAISLTTLAPYPSQHMIPIVFNCVKLTQADWINFTKLKGVISPSAWIQVTGTSAPNINIMDTLTYGVAVVNNAGTAYTATSTSIVIDGAAADSTTPRVAPYFIMSSVGEIMEVTADSTPKTATSTLTVRRGCLGTTASASGIADNNTLMIMNQIVLAGSSVGPVVGGAFTLYEDSKAKIFTTAVR